MSWRIIIRKKRRDGGFKECCTFKQIKLGFNMSQNKTVVMITYSGRLTQTVRLWSWLIIDMFLSQINNSLLLLHRNLSLSIYLLACMPCSLPVSHKMLLQLCMWIALPPPISTQQLVISFSVLAITEH